MLPTQTAPTVFERLTPTSLRHIATQVWTGILVLLHGTGLLITADRRDLGSVYAASCLFLMGVTLPAILAWQRNALVAWEQSLATFVDVDGPALESWLHQRVRRAFTGEPSVWMSGVIASIAATVTAFRSVPHDTAAIVWLIAMITVLTFFCGTLVHSLVVIMTLPSSIARLPMRVNLYQVRTVGFRTLSRFVTRQSALGLFYYCLVFVAFTTGHFASSSLTIIWLGVLGLLVSLLLPVSLFGLSRSMRSAKNILLGSVARQLDVAFAKAVEAPTVDNLGVLHSLMELKDEVEQLPEWPINFRAKVTMAASVLLPIAKFIWSQRG